MKFQDDISNRRTDMDTQAETNMLPTFSKLGGASDWFQYVFRINLIRYMDSLHCGY